MARSMIIRGAELDMSAVPAKIGELIQAMRLRNYRDRPDMNSVTSALFEISRRQNITYDIDTATLTPLFQVENSALMPDPRVLQSTSFGCVVSQRIGVRGEAGISGGLGYSGQPGDTPDPITVTVSRAGVNLNIECGTQTLSLPGFLLTENRAEIFLTGGPGGNGGSGTAGALPGRGGPGGAGGTLTVFTKDPETLPFLYFNVAGGPGGLGGGGGGRAASGAEGTIIVRVATSGETVVSMQSLYNPQLVHLEAFTAGERAIYYGSDFYFSNFRVINNGGLRTPPNLELKLAHSAQLQHVNDVFLESIEPSASVCVRDFAKFHVLPYAAPPFPPVPVRQCDPQTVEATLQPNPHVGSEKLRYSVSLYGMTLPRTTFEFGISLQQPIFISSLSQPRRIVLGKPAPLSLVVRNQTSCIACPECQLSVSVGAGSPFSFRGLTDLRLVNSVLCPAPEPQMGTVHRGLAIDLQTLAPGATVAMAEPMQLIMEAQDSSRRFLIENLFSRVDIVCHLASEGSLMHSVTTSTFSSVEYEPDPGHSLLYVEDAGGCSPETTRRLVRYLVGDAPDCPLSVYDRALYEREDAAVLERHRARRTVARVARLGGARRFPLPTKGGSLLVVAGEAEGAELECLRHMRPLLVLESDDSYQAYAGSRFSAALPLGGVERRRLGRGCLGCGRKTVNVMSRRLRKALLEIRREHPDKVAAGLVFGTGRPLGVICELTASPLTSFAVGSGVESEQEALLLRLLDTPTRELLAMALSSLEDAYSARTVEVGCNRVLLVDLLGCVLYHRARDELTFAPDAAFGEGGVLAETLEAVRRERKDVMKSGCAGVPLLSPFAVSKGAGGLPLEDATVARLQGVVDAQVKPLYSGCRGWTGMRFPDTPARAGVDLLPKKGRVKALSFASALKEAGRRYTWGNIARNAVSGHIKFPLYECFNTNDSILRL